MCGYVKGTERQCRAVQAVFGDDTTGNARGNSVAGGDASFKTKQQQKKNPRINIAPRVKAKAFRCQDRMWVWHNPNPSDKEERAIKDLARSWQSTTAQIVCSEPGERKRKARLPGHGRAVTHGCLVLISC